MFKYIIHHLPKDVEDEFTIGVVCPYSPQAQLIESLILQTPSIPSNVKITVGTVHRFQGGQCNFMFVVLNPPLGMKGAAERIFLNNKNILNVAISRAQDYLCILLPHKDTEGYENLYEINNIGAIAMKEPDYVTNYTCDQIEEIIFGKKFFIESNTFVTSHQLTNVYTKAVKRYEVRIDEKSVDIQLGVKAQQATTMSIIANLGNLKSKEGKEDIDTFQGSISKEAEISKTFTDPVEYYDLFYRLKMNFEKALELLASANTICSLYVLIQIFGNPEIAKKYKWGSPRESDIKNNKEILMKYEKSKSLYNEFFYAIRHEQIPIKGIARSIIKNIDFYSFTNAYKTHIERMKQKPQNKIFKI